MSSSNNPCNVALSKTHESLIEFINSLDEGFELLELIFDKQGNVVDFVFLEVNPAYEKQTGLKAANLIGKRKKEVAPASEQRWYDYAIQAAESGKTLQYEYYNDKVNGYFETQFIPLSTNQIAVLFKDITEGKSNEAVLRAKEFELYSIYANVSEVLFFLSVEPENHFRFVSVNKSFLDVTGLLENQVVGKSVQEVIPETSLKVVLEKYTQAIAENKTLMWEEITDYPAGKKYGEVSITPLFDSSGRCTNLVGSVHDVTERKKSEEVLRQSQLDLRLIFDSVNDGFWDWNMVSGKAVFSPKYFTMLGYEVGEFASDFSTLKSLIHPDDVKLVEKTIEACSKRKEPFAIEIRLKTKAGDWCWVLSRGKIVEWDNQGKPIRMVGAHTDISERKKMEEILGESQKKYQALTETTNDFVWEMDAQGRYTYCSPQMEKLWGLKPSDMIGKTPFDVMPPGDKERALEFFVKRGNSAKPFRGLQTTAHNSQGSLIYVETNGVPFFDEHGGLLGFRGISRDITERKKAEESMLLNEMRLQFTLDINKMLGASNQELMNYTLEAIRKITLSEFSFIGLLNDDETVMTIHSWSKTAMEECKSILKPIHFPISEAGVWAEPIRQKKPLLIDDYSVSIPCKKGLPEGHVAIKRYLGAPVFEKEHIVAIAAVANKKECYDQTDVGGVTSLVVDMWRLIQRKKAEENLRENEVKFRTVADFTYDWEFWIAPNGHLVYVSPSCNSITGYEADEFIKDPKLLTKIVHPEDKSIVGSHFELINSDGLHEFDFRIVTRTGDTRWISHNCRAVFDDNGKWIGRRASNRDITERKKMEKQMQDQERLAAIGATAGMVGHDIRNPLQAIISELYIAKGVLAEPPESKDKQEFLDSVNFVEEQVNYINKIVSDLQDYARPLHPEYAMVNLPDLLVSVFDTIALSDKIKLKVDIKNILKLKTDSTFIKRIVTNLVNNAIQAMPDGGELGLSAQKKEACVVICVSDTGQGIPEQVKANLFKPLTTTKAKGQGLGLAVVKRLVEALNGKIGFESEVGKGAKFIIELPAQG